MKKKKKGLENRLRCWLLQIDLSSQNNPKQNSNRFLGKIFKANFKIDKEMKRP